MIDLLEVIIRRTFFICVEMMIWLLLLWLEAARFFEWFFGGTSITIIASSHAVIMPFLCSCWERERESFIVAKSLILNLKTKRNISKA